MQTEIPDHTVVQQSPFGLSIEEKRPDPDIYKGSTSSMNMAPPSSSALIGDYIGIESCLDLKGNEDVFTSSSNKEETSFDSFSQRLREKRAQRWAKKKEFPPPIPLLARTENLPSHMPWVLKRYYTSDGRLILREEKVRHHEYFRAHRSNGRLTLHLVPLDDEVSAPFFVGGERHDHNNIQSDHLDCCSDKEEEEEEEEEEGKHGVENDNEDGSVVIKDEITEEGEEKVLVEDRRVPSVDSSGTGIGGNGGKCLNYNSVRTSSGCVFGVLPVPAIRPVHS